MVNGGKKEAIQENRAVEKVCLNNDAQTIYPASGKFYGGADVRANRVRVISDKSLPIEGEE